MAMRSKTTLFNAALLRCGQKNISAGDGSFIWQALDANYDEIVRECFERGDFPFGKTRVELTGRSAGRWGYDDAYVIPEDALHIVEVYIGERAASDIRAQWEFDGGTREVLLNAGGEKVEIEYRKTGQEHTWSATFSLAVQRRLEAVVKDVIEEAGESIAKGQEADLMLLRASVKGSRGRLPERVFDKHGGRLVRAHRGVR